MGGGGGGGGGVVVGGRRKAWKRKIHWEKGGTEGGGTLPIVSLEVSLATYWEL